jgi:hypothetical protein
MIVNLVNGKINAFQQTIVNCFYGCKNGLDTY